MKEYPNVQKTQKIRSFLRFSVSFTLAFVFIFSALFVPSAQFVASASESQNLNAARSREIHVVYDNSSSMFIEFKNFTGIDRWCYAKYAMEAFTAMLNDNDIMKVYPMNPVTSLGVNYSESNPITIYGTDKAAGVSIIHDMLSTEKDGETPFSTVQTAAVGYSTETAADDRYLVILTDGKFQGLKGDRFQELDSDYVEDEIESISESGIHVLYLGMGSAELDADLDYNEGGIGSVKIIDVVNDACNTIFSRNTLDDRYISGNKIRLDISMKQIIVFAQGETASLGTLSGGKTFTANPLEIKSSDKSSPDGADGKGGMVVDLNGYIAVYSAEDGSAIEAGEYTLDYSGDIKVFYEPNVDIFFSLDDGNGNVITSRDAEKNVAPGQYKIELKLVDAVSGEDVSSFIDDIKMEAVIIKGNGDTSKPVKSGDKVKLESDDKTAIKITGTYLDGKYNISNEDKMDDFTIHVGGFGSYISMKNDYFCTMTADKWEDIRVNYTVNAMPVNAEQFAKISLAPEDVKIDGSNIQFDVVRDDENYCYLIKLKLNDGEKLSSDILGDCSISSKSVYAASEGSTQEHYASKEMEIRFIPEVIKRLIPILCTAFALGLLAFILFGIKVLPKKMWIEIDEAKYPIKIKGSTANIHPDGYDEQIDLRLKANCNIFQCYIRKQPSVLVEGIEPPEEDFESISFKGHSLTRDAGGIWCDASKPNSEDALSGLNISLSGNKNQISWMTVSNFVDNAFIKLQK